MNVLFAGIDDWLPIIVPVASIAVYVLNQIFDRSGQKQQMPRRRPFELEQQESIEEAAEDEVARMVREATERSRQRSERNRRPTAAPARPRDDWRSRGDVVEAEIVEERPRPLASKLAQSESGVATHVSQYLVERERQFSKSVEADVSTDDVKSHLDEEVHAKFDHQVGTLDGAVGGASERDSSESNLVRTLFSEPENFRKAFILQEILDPPAR